MYGIGCGGATAAIALSSCGCHIAGQFNTSGIWTIRYDAASETTTSQHQHIGPPPTEVKVDLSVAKYGDGFGRVYWATTSGYERSSLGNFSTSENIAAQPSGPGPLGNGWQGPAAGLAIDGASNAAWVIAQSADTSTLYLV